MDLRQGISLHMSSLEWFLEGSFPPSSVAHRVEVKRFPFVIGRRRGLDLTIPDEAISRMHAQITERDGKLLLRDLGSLNGTTINGDEVDGELELRNGDLLQFADIIAHVHAYEVNNVRPALPTAPERRPVTDAN